MLLFSCVEGGGWKIRREVASLPKAERYMSINWSVSSTIVGRRIRGIIISCGTL
jgi:hypothetical protein